MIPLVKTENRIKHFLLCVLVLSYIWYIAYWELIQI